MYHLSSFMLNIPVHTYSLFDTHVETLQIGDPDVIQDG